ncbi:hypothetical protein B0H21DRAFT_752491 [Amylocystis lapponica]|nr:hypothetical protein B0H21DRAFT_752491 [Amylocystis lapponica]
MDEPNIEQPIAPLLPQPPKADVFIHLMRSLDRNPYLRLHSLNGRLPMQDLYYVLQGIFYFHKGGRTLPWGLYSYDPIVRVHDHSQRLLETSGDPVSPGSYIAHIDDAAIDTLSVQASVAHMYMPSSRPSSSISPRSSEICDCDLNAPGAHIQNALSEKHQRFQHVFIIQESEGLTEFVSDPYNSSSSLIPAKRSSEDSEQPAPNHTDARRMNSLDNGLLLCANHHIAFDVHDLLIRPYTHTVFAMDPVYSSIHGLEITKPWSSFDPASYPPPSDKILECHFRQAVYGKMKVAAVNDNTNEYDSDEDEDDVVIRDIDIALDNRRGDLDEVKTSRLRDFVQDQSNNIVGS